MALKSYRADSVEVHAIKSDHKSIMHDLLRPTQLSELSSLLITYNVGLGYQAAVCQSGRLHVLIEETS